MKSRSLAALGMTICLALLMLAQGTRAQLQVGDDLKMNLNGLLTGGYNANYGDQIPSNHGLYYGGNAQLFGSYYDPNFLSFTISPYYNQSRANSSFQSLTDSTGVQANANFFGGSRFPGYASYHYEQNSTGTLGMIGSPNFTTVGTGHGFGIGWSALIPDWPTLSVSYSQGAGNGTLFGTNEETNSSTRTLNARSSYYLAGWRLNANYSHLNLDSTVPLFLAGEQGNTFSRTGGNNYSVNGSHNLPWHGAATLSYSHSTYSGNFGSTLQERTGSTDLSTDTEAATANFRPTQKLSLFANQTYTNNLNGFLYQNIASNGSGVPLRQSNSQSNSSTLAGGASYTFTNHLYGAAQITYFDQSYFGRDFSGSYLTGTLGYGRRILDTFSVSASVIESSNRFQDNSLGFTGNLNAFHRFGLWEFSGLVIYSQNVQTLLVTYTTSFYNYSANVHRSFGGGKQLTANYSGSHSGFEQHAGSSNSSDGFSLGLSSRHIAITGNYTKADGQALLTSTGVQPIQPTPGLPPLGIIVYNAKSYGGGISLTPNSRLTISGNYSHAVSDTLSNAILSNNRTEVFYSQLQYRLRQINLVAGYTKFTQGFTAAGIRPGSNYSYFIGVTRYFNFF